jgi:hypothetical protein
MRSYEINSNLEVLQTLKGDGHKPRINIDNWSYGAPRDLVEGQTILAFLQRVGDPVKGDNNTYELVSTRESAKHLSANELETYLKRLDELKAIVSDSDYKSADVVEWLVRCADDPVTRREGAFELNTSAQREAWEKKDLARRAEAGEILNPSRKSVRDEERFAALLTDQQKERLAKRKLTPEAARQARVEMLRSFLAAVQAHMKTESVK